MNIPKNDILKIISYINGGKYPLITNKRGIKYINSVYAIYEFCKKKYAKNKKRRTGTLIVLKTILMMY